MVFGALSGVLCSVPIVRFNVDNLVGPSYTVLRSPVNLIYCHRVCQVRKWAGYVKEPHCHSGNTEAK